MTSRPPPRRQGGSKILATGDLARPIRVVPSGSARETTMTKHNKTMKDVVAALRRESAGALLELFELDVAVGELVLINQRLCANLRELAEDADQLAKAPGLVSPARLVALAATASSTSATAVDQTTAFDELKRGLAAWSIGA